MEIFLYLLCIFWYEAQQVCVRWNNSLSDSFCVSNGVRQGGVLSPIVFAVYIDGLLEMLESSGIIVVRLLVHQCEGLSIPQPFFLN